MLPLRGGALRPRVTPEARSAEDTETLVAYTEEQSDELLHQRLDPRRILKLRLECYNLLCHESYTRGSIRGGY